MTAKSVIGGIGIAVVLASCSLPPTSPNFHDGGDCQAAHEAYVEWVNEPHPGKTNAEIGATSRNLLADVNRACNTP